MYFILFYDVVDDYIDRRVAFRQEHLAMAKRMNESGELVLAGAYDDPPDGAALVFRTDDPSKIEEFVNADPYVKNGLVRSWRIRKWNVVIGGEQTP